LHYDRAVDVEVARTTIDDFILKWPIRWTDGTITRDQPGDNGMDAIGWFNTSSHNFVWGDDAYMGLTLPARMILAGLDTKDFKYAQLCAKQSRLSVAHLRDAEDELLWHGVDAKAGKHSCCKWGRANGWTLMMQAEVLDALSHSAWSGAGTAVKIGKAAFVKHCDALAKVQSNDGRWHQVLTNRSTYLESSGTAMYIVAMALGIDRGWLDASKFSAVLESAWSGLSTQILENGLVEGICDVRIPLHHSLSALKHTANTH
jgi:rhamnogalacturonyl hydrolase YesR